MTAVHDKLPKCTNVACFDSGFHATMPEHVKTYAIDQSVAKAKGLRKYGFHGLSYSFILRETAKFLNKPAQQTNLIALHLGSGFGRDIGADGVDQEIHRSTSLRA